MLKTQVGEIQLTLSARESYDVDLKGLLISHLTARFVGTCQAKMMVTRVVEILKHGNRYNTQSFADGSTTVDVQYKIEGVYYQPGDLLGDCYTAKDVGNGNIIGHNEAGKPKVVMTCIPDPTDPVSKQLRAGLIIPVEVIPETNSVVATAYSQQIQLRVRPFQYRTITAVYKLRPTADDPDLLQDLAVMAKLMLEVEAELKALTKEQKTRYDYLKDLFWPVSKGLVAAKDGQIVSVSELIRNAVNAKSIDESRLWIQTPMLEMSTGKIVVAEAMTPALGKSLQIDIFTVKEIEHSPYGVLRDLARRYIQFQKMVITQARLLDEAKMKEHKVYWSHAYKKM